MNIKSILLMLLCISEVKCFDHDVVPACGPDAKTCEFNWTVDYLETMVVFEDGGRGYPVVLRNGTLMKRTSCDTFEPLNEIGKTIYISYCIHFFIIFPPTFLLKIYKCSRIFACTQMYKNCRNYSFKKLFASSHNPSVMWTIVITFRPLSVHSPACPSL